MVAGPKTNGQSFFHPFIFAMIYDCGELISVHRCQVNLQKNGSSAMNGEVDVNGAKF